MPANNRHLTLNRNKSMCSGEKEDKSQHDSFNIFKSKESNKDNLNSQTKNNDIFNLNDIKDDLFDFSIQSINKSNLEVNNNEYALFYTNKKGLHLL